MAYMHLKKLMLAALFASVSQSAMASYVSDGSSGEFHPLSDVTLDLRDLSAIPQFSNIYIDAGIHITVLTPGTGYGYLLSADSIFLNGILDAGTGALSLNAVNSIVMGTGSQLTGGNLELAANSFNLQGTIQVTGSGSLSGSTPDKSQPISWGRVILGGGGDLTISNGGDISLSAPVPLPAASILLGSGLLGLLSFSTGRRQC